MFLAGIELFFGLLAGALILGVVFVGFGVVYQLLKGAANWVTGRSFTE